MTEYRLLKLREIVVDGKKGIVSGPFGSNLKTSDYTNAGVPIIRLQNVKRTYLNSNNLVYTSKEKAEQLSSHSFRPGDILVSKLGDDLGRACIAPDEIGEGIVSADVVRIRVDPEIASAEYVMYAINNPASTVSLAGDIQGVTRPRVSLDNVRDLEIYLPTEVRIQNKVVHETIERMKLISHWHSYVSTLETRLLSLKNQFFTNNSQII